MITKMSRKNLTEKIKELEKEKQRELRCNLSIYGAEAKVLTAKNMAELLRLAYPDFKIPNLPLIAEARIDAPNDLSEFLWRYNWLTSSTLSRVECGGKDYGVFAHINPFDPMERLIELYQESIGQGEVRLYENDVRQLLSKVDGKNIIAVPFKDIKNSPRGVVPLRDIVRDKRHVVALGAFGNNKQLLDSYVKKYIEVMSDSPFTPSEMGIWFSEEAGINTLRPFELGDSGIGIYNRNLTNKEYRALGLTREK